MLNRRFTLGVLGCALISTTAFAGGGNRKGKLNIDGQWGPAGGREIQVMEPSMCEEGAGVDWKLKWNRNSNTVRVKGKFEGLPYRPDICYDYNPTFGYNEYPDCIDDGAWQIWFVGHYFTKTTDWWYGPDGILLYNEFDMPPEGPPPGAFPTALPTLQMVCSPLFESNPNNLKARVNFRFDYDCILDDEGAAGVYVGVVPRNLFLPDPSTDLVIYYTEGGLPLSEAMHMDDILDEYEGGTGGIILDTSLEPQVKPDYLASRDNLMIGWGGQVGALPPANQPEVCETFQYSQF